MGLLGIPQMSFEYFDTSLTGYRHILASFEPFLYHIMLNIFLDHLGTVFPVLKVSASAADPAAATTSAPTGVPSERQCRRRLRYGRRRYTHGRSHAPAATTQRRRQRSGGRRRHRATGGQQRAQEKGVHAQPAEQCLLRSLPQLCGQRADRGGAGTKVTFEL